ncbi:MAG: hypothetical protein M3122_06685 [Actinomycetota bacterium]|nr:hypothetical protein [Actinomycetota bacterium]
MAGKTRKKGTLRPDTTLAPVEEPEAEVYVRGLPGCCLRSFKEAVVARGDYERLAELRCSSCGRGWKVTSSLDERVVERFDTHGRTRATDGTYPAA